MPQLIGPFTQLLTMDRLPLSGPVLNRDMEILSNAGILVEGDRILATGEYNSLARTTENDSRYIPEIPMVAMPGFIDAHTHICFAGSRSEEYSMRISGESYASILAAGGGIYNTVDATRKSSYADLKAELKNRAMKHFNEGITTIEVKSGYGLNTSEEIRLLKIISEVNKDIPPDLVSTCLAAHVTPPGYSDEKEYLDEITRDLLPRILNEKLSSRVDIFIEDHAFSSEAAESFLSGAMKMGFRVTIHADQFTTGGSRVAARLKVLSADHLEAGNEPEFRSLASSGVSAVVLPGASMGLGMPFAKARQILDTGCSLVIASDWNPGTAPMGDLLVQASVLSAREKLTDAETFAAMTFRAAHALRLDKTGVISKNNKADIKAFPVSDFREILYHQGQLKPSLVWKNGKKFNPKISDL